MAVAPVIPAATRSLEKPGGREIGPVTATAGRALSGGAEAIQVGDQVGEVALRQPGGQPIGHQRCVVGHALLDLRLADDMPAPLGVDERQLLCRTPP